MKTRVEFQHLLCRRLLRPHEVKKVSNSGKHKIPHLRKPLSISFWQIYQNIRSRQVFTLYQFLMADPVVRFSQYLVQFLGSPKLVLSGNPLYMYLDTNSKNTYGFQSFYMSYSVCKFLSVCKEASPFVKFKIEKEDLYMLQTGQVV